MCPGITRFLTFRSLSITAKRRTFNSFNSFINQFFRICWSRKVKMCTLIKSTHSIEFKISRDTVYTLTQCPWPESVTVWLGNYHQIGSHKISRNDFINGSTNAITYVYSIVHLFFNQYHDLSNPPTCSNFRSFPVLINSSIFFPILSPMPGWNIKPRGNDFRHFYTNEFTVYALIYTE